jgi:hypothetical protein
MMLAASFSKLVLKNNVSRASSTSVVTMIREVQQLDNDTLCMMAIEGNEDANKERLIREIMAKDSIEYDVAKMKFRLVEKANRSGMFVATLPYKTGIVVATGAALATFPLCFDLETAKWFNEAYVTAEVAKPEDLETWLEVGSWTWNWMEPPLGQLSFFLLCLQYARAQMEKIGWTPYTSWLKTRRAQNLSRQFPQYHKGIVESYSINAGLK